MSEGKHRLKYFRRPSTGEAEAPRAYSFLQVSENYETRNHVDVFQFRHKDTLTQRSHSSQVSGLCTLGMVEVHPG